MGAEPLRPMRMSALRSSELRLDHERRNLLLALTDFIHLPSSTSELLAELAWRLQPILPIDFFLLWFPASDKDTIALKLWQGANRINELSVPLAQSSGALVWHEQKPLSIENVPDEKRFRPEMRWLREHEVMSCNIVPLTDFRNRLGALAFASKRSDGHLDCETPLLRGIAEIIALSLDSTLPVASSREEADRLRVLVDCTNPQLPANGFAIECLLQSLQKWAAEDIIGIYSYDAASQSLRLQMLECKLIEKMAPDGGLTPLEGTLAPAFSFGETWDSARRTIALLMSCRYRKRTAGSVKGSATA